MKKVVVIVAGGKGERMGSSIAKQFLELHGLPVLMHTINTFYRYDAEIKIRVVLPENHLDYWKELCKKFQFNIGHQIIVGGEARFFSVKNGIQNLEENCIVAIHDGVRPLVSIPTIERCFECALKTGNAIPVIPVSESVRKISPKGNAPVNRETFRLVQTPQVFSAKILQYAYMQEYSPKFTDDASVVEKSGIKINLVEGNIENIKITNSTDLLIAEALMK
ncbi:MAG: 2-C-methyl-D-erythritol 4-phosphate cytidylyltransferase [Bacteroidales bacterium]|nr:2-C-methyl-D-erythritol 4-phosphate cytidylyltransferase [Bacteroidales bacterium]